MICIIPARGGSKRLPGKNLLKLDGEYIINRVIEIATESGIFTNIIVSTDSDQIADIVEGAAVSMRPEQIRGDIAEDKVLNWTAYKYNKYNNPEFCRIYPFAVLLTPERLCSGYKEAIQNKYDAVLECQKYGHPPERRFTLKGGYKQPSLISLPTESIEETFHDAGTYMFTRVDALKDPLAKRNIKWLPVNEWDAQDLDTIYDWKMLMMKWNNRKIDK